MIRSDKLRKAAAEAHCFLNIAGVCNSYQDGDGAVLCHIRLPGDCGVGMKPDDTCSTFGCAPCHRVFDANGCPPLSETDWNFYALRGMARTTRWLYDHGYISIKGAK